MDDAFPWGHPFHSPQVIDQVYIAPIYQMFVGFKCYGDLMAIPLARMLVLPSLGGSF